ncbi:MAG: Rrf2 family transcriptional regulator [Oscillospiraceae bacterium]|nr:Rrf2 family transcriptional regulator [Oscillospiraceae bacterium]
MLLTKESDYGVRIIRALADGVKKTVDTICAAEHIPDKYAYKILKKLERAGFLQSLRGRDGGYRLIRPLETFSVYDVVSAIDNNLLIFECLKQDVVCPLNSGGAKCAVHKEYTAIQNSLKEALSARTMKQIIYDTDNH